MMKTKAAEQSAAFFCSASYVIPARASAQAGIYRRQNVLKVLKSIDSMPSHAPCRNDMLFKT
jgi:hypothetical protein